MFKLNLRRRRNHLPSGEIEYLIDYGRRKFNEGELGVLFSWYLRQLVLRWCCRKVATWFKDGRNEFRSGAHVWPVMWVDTKKCELLWVKFRDFVKPAKSFSAVSPLRWVGWLKGDQNSLIPNAYSFVNTSLPLFLWFTIPGNKGRVGGLPKEEHNSGKFEFTHVSIITCRLRVANNFIWQTSVGGLGRLVMYTNSWFRLDTLQLTFCGGGELLTDDHITSK